MQNRWLAWVILASGAALAALAIQHESIQWAGSGRALGAFSPKLLAVMAVQAISGLLALAGLILSFTPFWKNILARLQWAAEKLGRLGAILPAAAGLLWLAFLAAMALPAGVLLFAGFYPRLWAAWLLALAQLALWQAWRPAHPALAAWCGGLLCAGAVFILASFRGDLASTPFSLSWSDGSRFYNASTWFAQSIYGTRLPLPELHPTRYLLQSLAFLIPGASIAFHRAWQVFLWLACNGLAAWALARRVVTFPPAPPLAAEGGQAAPTPHLVGKKGWLRVLLALWVFVFFFQGPVYYHLVVCALVVLLGFDRNRFWRSLAVVILASLWAGWSRINWYPVPGALAVMLYLLEEPQGSRPFWRYLAAPALWVMAGLAAAFAANAAYVPLSGNPAEVFGSALSSPLLWYRLLANPTYGPGILTGSLVLLPPLLISAWAWLRSVTWPAGMTRQNWLRWLGLGGILAAFFGSGIIVSLKVGGGSNLHNLDGFIVFLAVSAVYLLMGRFAPDRPGAPLRVPGWLALAAVVVPVVFAAANLSFSVHKPPRVSEVEALAWVQGMVDRYGSDGRPVLFISERQLITFHKVRVGNFEPAYEKVFLMEMAMSGNPAYLNRFDADLSARKFGLIISEPMHSQIQENRPFAEENNLWVKRVEEPVLGRYKLVDELDEYKIAIYVPK